MRSTVQELAKWHFNYVGIFLCSLFWVLFYDDNDNQMNLSGFVDVFNVYDSLCR